MNIFISASNKDHIYAEAIQTIATTVAQYKPLNIYPTVRRDLSLLIDSSVLFDDLKEIAFAVDNKMLKNVNLFDVYKDDKIPEGKKAYALSFVMVDEMKTLTDKRVDIVMNKIIKTYVKEFKAEIR